MNPRTSAHSHRILALAVLALLFHALMPLLMIMPAQVGVPMTVCSTLGMKTVFVKFDLAGESDPAESLQPRCPLCIAASQLSLMPDAIEPVQLLVGLMHVQFATVLAQLGPEQGWLAYLARAPPVFSV